MGDGVALSAPPVAGPTFGDLPVTPIFSEVDVTAMPEEPSDAPQPFQYKPFKPRAEQASLGGLGLPPPVFEKPAPKKISRWARR